MSKIRVGIITGSTRPGRDKAVAFVSYGSAGGVRAVEQMRLVVAELKMADVRAHVSLSLFTDFENFSVFTPHPRHRDELGILFDQVIEWGGALRGVRIGLAEE